MWIANVFHINVCRVIGEGCSKHRFHAQMKRISEREESLSTQQSDSLLVWGVKSRRASGFQRKWVILEQNSPETIKEALNLHGDQGTLFFSVTGDEVWSKHGTARDEEYILYFLEQSLNEWD